MSSLGLYGSQRCFRAGLGSSGYDFSSNKKNKPYIFLNEEIRS